jgi:hypothetical protein
LDTLLQLQLTNNDSQIHFVNGIPAFAIDNMLRGTRNFSFPYSLVFHFSEFKSTFFVQSLAPLVAGNGSGSRMRPAGRTLHTQRLDAKVEENSGQLPAIPRRYKRIDMH